MVSSCSRRLRELLDKFGLAGIDLVNQLHRELGNVTFFDESQKLKVTEIMAETDLEWLRRGRVTPIRCNDCFDLF